MNIKDAKVLELDLSKPDWREKLCNFIKGNVISEDDMRIIRYEAQCNKMLEDAFSKKK